MSRAFVLYSDALAYAVDRAKTLGKPFGISKAKEFGQDRYVVRGLPERPQDRYGWERSAEVVEPE